MRNHIMLTVIAIFIVAGFWAGSQSPSDEAVIEIYRQHRDSLIQLVRLYQEDQVGMIIHRNGSVFPSDAIDQLSAERLDLYQAFVRESGITRSLWNQTAGSVTFQVFNPIPLSQINTAIFVAQLRIHGTSAWITKIKILWDARHHIS